ncbi:hypothetical protein D1871_04735 [Nakamurella silvestris]|nr:hypothetical protein D1871_04735 [Nakamurella silvestris]
MTATIPETESYIQFRLEDLVSRNEHHRFEEIATRIARRRISSNILVATGPVSSGGDQQRDAETYTTWIPDELPHSAGFAASSSTRPVVVACTLQKEKLKAKVLEDLAGICAADADSVAHIAFFSVKPISAGITHDLKKTAREDYGVTLDVFSGAGIATILAEPDLLWVARHYLELPSALMPPPEGEPSPDWYSELLENLRLNRGPVALTPATQGEVTEGLRFATWDEDANADLPEWLDFMGAFLADTDEGADTELVFRACYEMALARFRGTGVAVGIEDLVRRAVTFACLSDRPNVLDDAVTLTSYWGVMWVSGAGRAEVAEIAEALERLRVHVTELLDSSDPSTHPVRVASLTGTLALLHLVPNWQKLEQEHGCPAQVPVADFSEVQLDDFEPDAALLADQGLLDVGAVMDNLDKLIDLLPRARAYSVSRLAEMFTMHAPLMSEHPSYVKVRDGLDTATAGVLGESVTAERNRDRAVSFVKAGRPLDALLELHNAKVNWFNGDTLYGTVLTMRYIGRLYAGLGLMYAAKMYACTGFALAMAHGDADAKEHAPKALMEAAQYSQNAGCWVDAAGLTEIALLVRSEYLSDPFDFDKHPDLADHRHRAALELAAIRKFWPDVEPLITAAHPSTGWFEMVAAFVDGSGAEYQLTEEEFQTTASEQLAGPVLGDLGPTRIVDFEALGVRWIFTYDNNRATVLRAEGFIAALQVLLADLAPRHPVLINSTMNVRIQVVEGTDGEAGSCDIDRSEPELRGTIVLPGRVAEPDAEARNKSLVGDCLYLLQAVHARPTADLMAHVDAMAETGMFHKLFVGQPYEDATDLLGTDHYTRCASIARPASSGQFKPSAPPALAASTSPGTGYDRDRALEVISERYELADAALHFTLPRLLADTASRARIAALREEGWLDWQIMVILVNIAGNWRVSQAGIQIGRGDPRIARGVASAPETAEGPEVPLEVFSADAFDLHSGMLPATAATRWDLHGRQEAPGEWAMRDLLTRRYHFTDDDVLHQDPFDPLPADMG